MTLMHKYLTQLNWEKLGMEALHKLISLVLLLLVFTVLKKLVRYIFKKTVVKSITLTGDNQNRQETLIKLFQNILDYGLYFILGYWVLAIIGVPISSLLAGAGIAGLAIGLGAQGFLTDLVNGIFILLERQYDVGDVVTIQGVTGTVTNLGIRTTQIRDFDGILNYVPNRNITLVSNLSRGNRRAQIDLPIPFTIDMKKVKETIETVNQVQVPKFPEIIGNPVILGPRTLPSGQAVYRIDITTTNGKQNDVYYAFYQHYQVALIEAGLIKED